MAAAVAAVQIGDNERGGDDDIPAGEERGGDDDAAAAGERGGDDSNAPAEDRGGDESGDAAQGHAGDNEMEAGDDDGTPGSAEPMSSNSPGRSFPIHQR